MDRKTKSFPVGAVISVVSGRMVSESHMDGIYEVLSWMASEDVYTHQIPRVIHEAAPVILAVHPELANAAEEAKQVKSDTLESWLATWKARYGEQVAVPVMTIAEHERIDPQSELAEKVHPDRIIEI